MRWFFVVLGLLGALSSQHAARADDVPAELKPAIEKSLDWLVKQQNQDGSSSDTARQSDVACTATAGLALLMEGSTAAKGKYAENIKRTIEWLTRNCQEGKDDGLFGLNAQQNRLGYMAGQSYAVLFLASAYAREDKSDAKGLEARLNRVRQRDMEALLKRAVQFVVMAQAANGGWSLISCRDGQNQDDAESTLQQILALRAAQQAGIEVPKETMQKAYDYLEKMTTPRGGVAFSLSQGKAGGERPRLTIAAFASTYGAEQVSVELLKKWFGYTRYTITQVSETPDLFYLAVAVHGLGDEGYVKLFGKQKPLRMWSKERGTLLSRFRSEGGTVFREWNSSPVFGTAICLIALQLDHDHLPIFRTKRNW